MWEVWLIVKISKWLTNWSKQVVPDHSIWGHEHCIAIEDWAWEDLYLPPTTADVPLVFVVFLSAVMADIPLLSTVVSTQASAACINVL